MVRCPSFVAFCLVPIPDARGQVNSIAWEWAVIFHRSEKIAN